MRNAGFRYWRKLKELGAVYIQQGAGRCCP